MRTVYAVIGCDVDPDRLGFLDGVPQPSDGLSWRGAREGIPALKELLHGVTDEAGRAPVITWLIRADEQVRELEGHDGWFARTHEPLLRSLRASGDELGWHPHFWRRGHGTRTWYQEIEDIDWQVEMLHQAHEDLVTCLPGPPTSVRMGWAYLNNRACRALEDLGIAVEFSAIPGYRTLTARASARRENLFDWYASPRSPFRPSHADYRRPAEGTEQPGRLLEAPSFVSTSLPWALVSGVQLARKTRDPGQLWQAVRRPTYCINVTARPWLFAPLVAELRTLLRRPDGAGRPLVFVTQFHADELVLNRSRLYGIESLRTNLEAVVRVCHEAQARLEFVPARRVPTIWPS